MDVKEFFTEYGEANRYAIKEVIGKGSYGVVCSAVDTKTGEKVAIKKINNVFDHVSDATRILREIKLLRLLRHPGKRCIPQDACTRFYACAQQCFTHGISLIATFGNAYLTALPGCCRHCGDQAHHVATQSEAVQRHLRGV